MSGFLASAFASKMRSSRVEKPSLIPPPNRHDCHHISAKLDLSHTCYNCPPDARGATRGRLRIQLGAVGPSCSPLGGTFCLHTNLLNRGLRTLNDLWTEYDSNGSDAETNDFRQSARLDKYANSFPNPRSRTPGHLISR